MQQLSVFNFDLIAESNLNQGYSTDSGIALFPAETKVHATMVSPFPFFLLATF